MKVSIRKKIIISFSIFILASTFIWFLNYYKYQVLTQKLRIIEKKDHIYNTILEARRSEKNFFLYNHIEDLEQAVIHVQDAENKVKKLIEEHGDYTFDRNLTDRLEELKSYKGALNQIAEIIKSSADAGTKKIDSTLLRQPSEFTRQLGHAVTVKFDTILKQERTHVNKLVQTSGYYLYFALAAIFLLTAATIMFIYYTVNRPLKSIENAIQKIAMGNHSHIPAVTMGDVFESLVVSLNNMIQELNRRNEQLVQAEKLASLGTLTSGVAHELNNPLNNISTSLQILLEEIEEGDIEYKTMLLSECENQIERAKEIVRALLEFSHSSHFHPRPVNFKRLVAQTEQLIKCEVPTGTELTIDIPDDITANLDVQRIQQVLINMAQNALQAMSGGGRITISAEAIKEKNLFSFRVADTGKGINKEDLPKLFDPFFTTKPLGEGSGLGLSISHGIIEQHHGRIEVESEPGKGTVFTVYLPTDLAVES